MCLDCLLCVLTALYEQVCLIDWGSPKLGLPTNIVVEETVVVDDCLTAQELLNLLLLYYSQALIQKSMSLKYEPTSEPLNRCA